MEPRNALYSKDNPGLFIKSIEIDFVESQKSWYSNNQEKTVKGKRRISFKLDTGVCGVGMLEENLGPTQNSLFVSGHHELNCVEVIEAELAIESKSGVKEYIYAVEL